MEFVAWKICSSASSFVHDSAGATGEEQAASQMRKEQYKQELLKQIAEEQMNKIR